MNWPSRSLLDYLFLKLDIAHRYYYAYKCLSHYSKCTLTTGTPARRLRGHVGSQPDAGHPTDRRAAASASGDHGPQPAQRRLLQQAPDSLQFKPPAVALLDLRACARQRRGDALSAQRRAQGRAETPLFGREAADSPGKGADSAPGVFPSALTPPVLS